LDENTTFHYYTYLTGENDPDFTIFFIPGSGCTSMKYYLKPYLSQLTGSARIYALQKRNLSSNNLGILACEKQFLMSDYFDQWVIDNKRFIEVIVSSNKLSSKPIVIFGVSEGGNVAAAITASLPFSTHLVVLGSGGMLQIDELKLILKKSGHKVDLDKIFHEITSDPKNINKSMFGQTYKYWNSVAYVDPLKYYADINIPILVGIGELDNSVPVESALFLRNYFHILKKNNLTLCIYSNADHTLVNSKGTSYRDHFLETMSNWIDKSNIVDSSEQDRSFTNFLNRTEINNTSTTRPFVNCY
jgi:esterase/lipase